MNQSIVPFSQEIEKVLFVLGDLLIGISSLGVWFLIINGS